VGVFRDENVQPVRSYIEEDEFQKLTYWVSWNVTNLNCINSNVKHQWRDEDWWEKKENQEGNIH
jgi:hypothetical protein